ncbi:MAG: plasmid pRiA4b ORF-3 family protein [Cyanobacteria bacterium P01_A01_bin.135]
MELSPRQLGGLSDSVLQGPPLAIGGTAYCIAVATPPDPKVRYPICIKGKRACPPEDCGGVWGYVEFLEAIADPEHPQHTAMTEWIGGEFEPEVFDLEEANRQLKRIR